MAHSFEYGIHRPYPITDAQYYDGFGATLPRSPPPDFLDEPEAKSRGHGSGSWFAASESQVLREDNPLELTDEDVAKVEAIQKGDLARELLSDAANEAECEDTLPEEPQETLPETHKYCSECFGRPRENQPQILASQCPAENAIPSESDSIADKPPTNSQLLQIWADNDMMPAGLSHLRLPSKREREEKTQQVRLRMLKRMRNGRFDADDIMSDFRKVIGRQQHMRLMI
jgi:hypothetical protein